MAVFSIFCDLTLQKLQENMHWNKCILMIQEKNEMVKSLKNGGFLGMVF